MGYIGWDPLTIQGSWPVPQRSRPWYRSWGHGYSSRRIEICRRGSQLLQGAIILYLLGHGLRTLLMNNCVANSHLAWKPFDPNYVYSIAA